MSLKENYHNRHIILACLSQGRRGAWCGERVLRISSVGDDQRILGGLKIRFQDFWGKENFEVFFWVASFNKRFLGYSKQSEDSR